MPVCKRNDLDQAFKTQELFIFLLFAWSGRSIVRVIPAGTGQLEMNRDQGYSIHYPTATGGVHVLAGQ